MTAISARDLARTYNLHPITVAQFFGRFDEPGKPQRFLTGGLHFESEDMADFMGTGRALRVKAIDRRSAWGEKISFNRIRGLSKETLRLAGFIKGRGEPDSKFFQRIRDWDDT